MRIFIIHIILLILFVGVSFLGFGKSIPTDTIEASRYFQKGKDFFNKTQYDSAQIYFSKAGNSYRTAHATHRFFQTQNRLLECYWRNYALKKGVELGKTLLRLYKSAPNEPTEADMYVQYAFVRANNGDYDLAINLFGKAIEKSKNSASHLAGQAFLGKGYVYYWKDQYAQALEYYQKAQVIFEREGASVSLVETLLQLGVFYTNQGSYALAEEHIEQALQIAENMEGERTLYVAQIYKAMADIFRDKRSYEKANEYYQQAIILYEELHQTKSTYIAACYLGIGTIHKQLDEFDQAQVLYEKALYMLQDIVGNYHAAVVECYLELANLANLRNDYEIALEYYSKVEDINYDLRGEFSKSNSNAFNNKAAIYYFQKTEYVTARSYFKKALQSDQVLYGEKHPNVANAYYNIAKTYEEQGNRPTALEYVQKALMASIEDFVDSNIYVNPTLENYYVENDLFYYLKFKAETLQEGFEKDGNADLRGLRIALTTYYLCDTLIERMRTSHTSEKDKITLGEQASKLYQSAARASYNLYKYTDKYSIDQLGSRVSLPELKNEFLRYHFYFSEKNKSAVLSASLADSKAKAFGGIPDSLLHIEDSLSHQIASYKLELAAKPDVQTEKKYREQLFKANRHYEHLIDYFEKQYPKYYELKHNMKMTTVQEIQNMLDGETAILSYFVGTEYIYISILTRDSLQVMEKEKVFRYEKYIKATRSSILYKRKGGYAKYAYELYRQLIPDNIPDFVRHLIIIPDGMMALIPFEVFLSDKIPSETPYTMLPYLVKRYQISYAFSAHLLYQTFEEHSGNTWVESTSSSQKQSKDFVGLAPVFSKNTVTKTGAGTQENLTKLQRDTTFTATGNLFFKGHITPIEATEQEIEAIHQGFISKQRKSEVYLHQGANESAIKEGLLQGVKYIHIATHGFVNEEHPELSGILLAQDSTSTEDGVLYSGEIYNLNLHCDMITLSACETGLGKISNGEGVIGLSRALLYAGTKNILVSLWKVSDASTAQLMINFYDELLNHPTESKVEALYHAKLKMMKEGKYAAPYYWSPFILIGK